MLHSWNYNTSTYKIYRQVRKHSYVQLVPLLAILNVVYNNYNYFTLFTIITQLRYLITILIKGPFTWKEDDPSAIMILGLRSSERGMFSAFSSSYA